MCVLMLIEAKQINEGILKGNAKSNKRISSIEVERATQLWESRIDLKERKDRDLNLGRNMLHKGRQWYATNTRDKAYR